MRPTLHVIPPVEVVEAKPKREFNPDAVVFGFCLMLLGVLIGAFVVTWQYRHAPSATCERLLPDGRNLIAYDLQENGRESRCVYEQPKHDVSRQPARKK